MSGFITLKGEDYILDVLCKKRSVTDAFYIALMTGQQPTKFVPGSSLEEPLVEEYERVEYHNEYFTWSVSGGEMRNENPIEFATALTDWPLVNHWAITDAMEDGDVLWAGTFSSPLEVPAGGALVIPAGGLVVRTANNTLRVNL